MRWEDKMKNANRWAMLMFMAATLAMATASAAQERTDSNTIRLAQGQHATISGVIVTRDSDNFVIRDAAGKEATVKLSGATAIKEKKSNPFREAKRYEPGQLIRGLQVEVDGLGDADGALAARDIRFTQTGYLVANSVESRVTPVEGQLKETGDRLTRSEENAKHLTGEIEEVGSIANAARGGAKAAQDTADTAIAGVNAANERIALVDRETNERISSVDDYEVKENAVIHFQPGSSLLTHDAKDQLDRLVQESKEHKGYVVEVTGFASADGNATFNRLLSKHRADAVVQYLADNLVPLRRIVTPFGFGVNQPVADNKTPAGRSENRRVEVKILMSKGLTEGKPGDAAGAAARK
jgi:outer membrane protein OmpA-like peptidoglycan-associated protein